MGTSSSPDEFFHLAAFGMTTLGQGLLAA